MNRGLMKDLGFSPAPAPFPTLSGLAWLSCPVSWTQSWQLCRGNGFPDSQLRLQGEGEAPRASPLHVHLFHSRLQAPTACQALELGDEEPAWIRPQLQERDLTSPGRQALHKI